MADNTDVTEVGEVSFQPKQENETVVFIPINTANSPPLNPTSPPQDPTTQPLTPDFTDPASPSKTTPLLVVTNESESNLATAESDSVTSDSSKENGVDSEYVNSQDEEHDQTNHLESQSNGERSRQGSGSTEGSRRNGPPTRSRAQPVLDASKLKEKETKNTHFRQQQLTERQNRIDNLRCKESTHRAEILERKKRQEAAEQARKEAIVRRSRERSENAHEKRRSWSAFGSRDFSSPVPSNGRPRTPRGRSTDRMTERQSCGGGILPLGTSKRLSSSVTSLHRPVHLVRLGPNEDDWFEVHIPEPLNRRASSSGNDKTIDSSSSPPKPASSSATPRHHLSSPNLASTYSTRDSRSAQSTPTHVSRPLSAAKRSSSNSRIDDDGSGTPTPGSAPPKRAPSPRTPLHGRPPSPRQQSAQVTPSRVPSPRTIRSQGSTTVDGRPKPARAPSPRSTPKQTNGDGSRKLTEGKKTPSHAPPIKKALTPRTDIAKSTVGSPTKTPTTPKSATKPSVTKLATTPKGGPKQTKPTAVKAAPSAATAAAAAPAPALNKPSPENEKAEVKTEESKETIQKETDRASSPSVSESSSASAPSSNGSVPAAQPAPAAQPSPAPAAQPSQAPAAQPSQAPAAQPSQAPAAQPSQAPAAQPSQAPAAQPSPAPAAQPSPAPAAQPSQAPAAQPSQAPAAQPSQAPAAQPSQAPAAQPSQAPAAQPSQAPAAQPSPAPAAQPSPAPKELTDEERAKQALAERRRQAREKAEREAELERQRREQLKREEEERIRLEEEERIRQEEEAMRLAKEHKKAEEERLQRAIEENEERERLEVERKAAEEIEAAQRAEEERLRQEELKRQEEELAEKCRKEEDERIARKKRVEEIMKKARRGAQAKDKDEPSEDGDSGSESGSGSGSGSERKTNGVNSILASSSLLNNEKYRNLLFNRNKTELSAEDEKDYGNDQMVEGAVNSSSDSEDRELSVEDEPADYSSQDQPEQSEGKGIEIADNVDIEHEVSNEDGGPDEIQDQPDWSEVKGAELEETLESNQEPFEDHRFDNGAVVDMDMTENGSVAEKASESNDIDKEAEPQMESTHLGVGRDVTDLGGAPPANGNENVEDRDDTSSVDEKSDGSSNNGCETLPQDGAPLLEPFMPPNNNVPASEDFNNANGEGALIESGTELITKKSLLDLDDVGGTPDEGDLTPDSACDKLNANLGMRPVFPSSDAQMNLSFASLDEVEPNGDQQPQPPMAVCLTPEDAV